MNPVTADSFAGLAAVALERMAFVVSEPSPETTPGEVLVSCAAHAVVAVRGEQGYTLAVGATPGIVREIASGMMGIEPDELDPDDHARATVDELANVLAGELVMLLTGGDGTLALSLPREAAAAEVDALLDGATAHGVCAVLVSDGGKLLLVVRPDGLA